MNNFRPSILVADRFRFSQTILKRHETLWRGCRRSFGLVAVLSLLLISCNRTPVLEIVKSGVSGESDGFWYQAEGLYLKENSPGVLFGMVKEPGKDRELKYLLVFKHRVTSKSKLNFAANASLGGRAKKTLLIDDGLDIDGNGVKLKLTLEFDETKKVTDSEELLLNGEKIDLTKGRVFLGDLSGAPGKWEQVQVKLPANLPDPTETQAVRELANRILVELPGASEQIRNFLK
jgi:hypothetical protein